MKIVDNATMVWGHDAKGRFVLMPRRELARVNRERKKRKTSVTTIAVYYGVGPEGLAKALEKPSRRKKETAKQRRARIAAEKGR